MAGKIPKTAVGNMVRREPIRLKPATSLGDVVAAMKTQERGAAIVEDDNGRPVGIVTEHDFRAKLDHGSLDWHSHTVDTIMNKNPKTIRSSQFLHEALALMISCKFRHVPVINDNDYVINILSIRDIIIYMAKLYPQEFLNQPPDPHTESSGRYGG
ncbi:MAG: CBS domain-containing protein [Gammaproteobacteria bacterium]|nr:CBS domain-containing protein [Gammaproteobacteria bacterium]